MMITHIITEVNNPLKRKLQLLPSPLQAFRQRAKTKFRICGVVLVLVVVLVLENPDRLIIRPTGQNICGTIGLFSLEKTPTDRGRGRRRARGRGSKLRSLG